MPHLEDLRVAISVLQKNYWPFIASLLENTNSPIINFININHLTFPTSFGDVRQRIRANFTRFHTEYIVIATFGLLTEYWLMAAAATLIYKLDATLSRIRHWVPPRQSGASENVAYSLNILRYIALPTSLWCIWSLHSIITAIMKYLVLFMFHATMLDSTAKAVEK
ncbi:uncharacterized protein CTRU02_215646 [Colletotrichum truncatum]|uniref:Uncharacterized protein n=1 Tax=Colletotrichum truncatum TaxID=5467 RepID=A0ACC3YCE2_COLTU|nr:uncharacterized protein CTRU02_05416 [Colletotrichum truncatum]KAF6793859.1 hypothetical protein CTRU02_05416 [Colletotrichum truncatum]